MSRVYAGRVGSERRFATASRCGFDFEVFAFWGRPKERGVV